MFRFLFGIFQWRRNEFESGGTGPAQKWWGTQTPTFLALKVQLVVLVSAFVMVSTVWWFLIGCSSTRGAQRAQPFVKVGARAPRAPWSWRHCNPLPMYVRIFVCAADTLKDRKQELGILTAKKAYNICEYYYKYLENCLFCALCDDIRQVRNDNK